MKNTKNIKTRTGRATVKAIRRFAILLSALAFPLAGAVSQEALCSTAENYYEFESLVGNAEREYLNYRTLSDSRWSLKDPGKAIWNGRDFGSSRDFAENLTFRVYGPDLYSSYNSAAPYGQNDGALWQGKGLNSSLTAGTRLEGFGFEITIKPHISFSQNLAFDLVDPAYSGSSYKDKADVYGYYGVWSVDAPQRFGDDPFLTFSWGDSEIRYSWKTLTIGFGTQAIWLGPAKINSIIHSNNAPPYPKLDAGIRKQPVYAFGHDLGFVESRLWCGYLSESDYFDNDSSNDHTMISGLAFSFAPSFLPGLTLSANRTYRSKWERDSVGTIPSLFFVTPGGRGDDDVWDQRAAFSFSWLFTSVGLEVYGEMGINDWVVGHLGYIRYPFHTAVYTGGLVKSFNTRNPSVRGEIVFEWTNLELSQDFQFQWPSTFYAHHLITQGYTNQGQWLGAGIGTGGNSQYLGCTIYYPVGASTVFVYRVNPDNDYLYQHSINTVPDEDEQTPTGTAFDFFRFKCSFSVGAKTLYHLTESMDISGSIVYDLIINPQYRFSSPFNSVMMNNFSLSFGASKYF